MVNHYAGLLALAIKKAAPHNKASVEVIQYGAIMAFNGGAVLLSVLLVGALLGVFAEAAMVLLIYSLLRFCTGGFHFSSALACYIFSTTVMVAIACIQLPAGSNLYLNLASMLLILIYAPSDLEKHTRIPKTYYVYLKLFAAIIVSLNFMIDSNLVALTASVQAVSLIKRRRNSE
jgi:accessory gene regulator B